MINEDELKRCFPFNKPRPHQFEIIKRAIGLFNESNSVVLNLPTGFGKSAIGVALANYYGSAYMLTPQKVLQDQYWKDFRFPVAKGLENFRCLKNGKSCTYGKCGRKSEHYCIECPYNLNMNRVYGSNISIFNYHKFLFGSKNPSQGKRSLLIVDECHNFEKFLIDTYTVTFDKKKLVNLLGSKFNPKSIDFNKDIEYIIFWISDKLFELIHSRVSELDFTINMMSSSGKDVPKSMIDDLNKLNSMSFILTRVLSSYREDRNSYIKINHDKNSCTLKLLYGKSVINNISKFSDRILFMSATVFDIDEFNKSLGLQSKYITMDPIFPKENMMIDYYPIGKVSYSTKNEVYPKLIKFIKVLIDNHKGEKGIIHCSNYEICQLIKDNIISDRLLFPNPEVREEVLKKFYKSKEDFILVSPSLQEGLDLKDDLSRFSIICKMPYPSLSDEWVKKRLELSNDWYKSVTFNSLVQMIGRSIRSETDTAKTYILDSNFSILLKTYNKVPKWFKDLIVKH